MKYIIIGLGNFGSSLSIRLTAMGHEVIGVDTDLNKVDVVKDKITHAIVLDATNLQAVKTLPFKDTDVVIVSIGEDIGASIMTTAIFKQLNPKRLISRAITPLHETVLQAIGVDEIVHPEEETAERLAKTLEMKGVVDSFNVSESYNIIEAKVPERYVGKTIAETEFRRNYNINVLTIIRIEQVSNIFGVTQKRKKVLGVVAPDTVMEKNDILVVFGDIKDIREMLHLE
jgi:trk system potassium uptake protein